MTVLTVDIEDVRSATGDISDVLTDRDLQELELILLSPRLTGRAQLLPPDPNHPRGLELGGCIVWTGCLTGSGPYGQIRVGHRREFVHRLALMELHGSAPAHPWGLHKCDRYSCFRPSHLRWGTQADNVADYVKRGPSPYRKAAR